MSGKLENRNNCDDTKILAMPKKIPKILKKLLLYVGLPVCFVILLFAMLAVYIDATEGKKNVNGIVVNEDLMFCLNNNYSSIKYCRQLKKATMGNVRSIKKIALIYPGGQACSYAHGSVLVGLIEYVGEDMFIHSLGTITEEQKK